MAPRATWSADTAADMQMSPVLIDYILVHELTHLRHFDHSPAFWRTAERAMPRYARLRARLRREGADLWLP